MSGSENQENLGMTKNGNAANGHSIPALRPPRFLSAQNQSDGYYANSQLPGNPISYINTNSTPTPPSDEDDSALFGNLLQIGWQRKWTILLCTLCGLVAGIVYLSRATPIYESTAVIYMDQAQPQIISENFGSGFAAQHSMSAQRQVLTSTSMLSRALEVPSMKQADSIWAATNPIGYVRKHLTVDFDESEEILLISMRSPSPEDNAITVNSLVQAYSEYHSDRRSHTAAEVLNVLHNEKLRLNKELDELAQQQLEFQKENGVAALRTKDGDSVFGNRLERLADTLAEAELLTLSAKTAYQSALHAGTDSDALRIVAVADPNYSKLEQNAAASTADAPERTLISNLYLERTRLVEAKGLGPGHYLITEIDA
ncbi:MAG: Wzz/FepE/Etk N-terminal domain-containing protein, partial [Planctomycetota bacterium]